MYMAPRTIAVAARKHSSVDTRKVPSRIRNSPTKPLVPGSPTEASIKHMNTKAYFGMRSTSPP